MLWWQWMVLGIVLLGAEMMVDAQFYLVFLGVSAVLVGLLALALPSSPMWLEWLLFSAIAIATLVLFRRKLFGKVRGNAPGFDQGVIGEIGIVEAEIAAGGSGRITFRGTTWTAHNVGDQSLPQNARVRIDAVSGVTVDVRSADA